MQAAVLLGALLLIPTCLPLEAMEDGVPAPDPVPPVLILDPPLEDDKDLLRQMERTEPEGPQPGQEAAQAGAPAQALEFIWDGYHSLVVVGQGEGLRRPAWVVTWEGPRPQPPTPLGVALAGLFAYRPSLPRPPVAVAYRALAWLDAAGRVHIDARKAVLRGAKRENWSPDSFMFTLPDRVDSIDDNPEHAGNRGRIDRRILPESQAAEYRRLLLFAQAMAEGGA